MRSVLLFLFATAVLAQTQAIVTVESAASGAAGVPASAVAPGSIILIQQVRGGPVQVGGDLSRYVVQVRALPGGEPVAAQVLAARLGSLLALFPKSVPPGEAEVTLSVDGQVALPARVRVTRAAVGLFAAAGMPFGPAIAQNVRPNAAVETNALLTPAVPGDYLVLWGTGLGETAMPDVRVEVAGRTAVPDYAGPAPGLPGVDQINVRLPAGIPEGCYVSLRLRTPESVSNEVTIAAASGRGPCRHPLGLTEAQLRDLDANRSVRVVQANLRSEVMPPAGLPSAQPAYTRNGAASIEFALRSPSDVYLISQPLLEDGAYFACRLQNSLTIPRLIFVDDFDAGPRIDVTGPAGKTLTATNEGVPILYVDFLEAPEPKPDPGDLPAPFFSVGVWTLSGPGGRSLAPFQAELALPPALHLTNADQLQTVDRARDQMISWAAEGYTERDVVTVLLTSRFVTQPAPAGVSANTIVCRAPAAAGQVTLPAALLQQIPPSPGVLPTMAATLELRLASHPYRRKIVDLPLTSGATEKMVLDYLHSEQRAVAIR